MPRRAPYRPGTAVYRRTWPMTEKGRVVAIWYSLQTAGWHAVVAFPTGEVRLGVDKLMEVPKNG